MERQKRCIGHCALSINTWGKIEECHTHGCISERIVMGTLRVDKGQSKKTSLFEAIANTVIALIITMAVLPVVNWLCGVQMNTQQLGLHVVLMTIVSIGRNYIIRRVFNRLKS